VLFTAGTTGPRRAVVVGHTRLRAAYTAWEQVWALDPTDRHLVTAAPDLPAFTGGWVRALGSGATLVLPHRPVDPGAWAWPMARGITVLDTDPATADTLLAAGAPATLRLVAVGGDRITVAAQDRLAGTARVLNVYGTAEDAGCGTWFETSMLAEELPDPERVSLLGRPFPGGRVDLDDGRIRLTPPGGGEAVVTGDRGLLRDDGLLEFRGRRAHRLTVGGRHVDPYPAEAALGAHPDIREAVVAADGDELVAYVVPEEWSTPGADAVRAQLAGVVPEREIPERVVLLTALPRNRAGKPERRLLPRQAWGRPSGGGKGGAPMTRADWSLALRWLATALVLPVALGLGGVLWPGSTDLSAVPQPWATLFTGLYLAELAALVVGVGFLLLGRPAMVRQGRSPGLTAAAHLAIGWLLVSWWPQDNLYRLAAKDDWPQQATLVYVFNVTLMIAAAVVAVFATRPPRPAG
jgi:acyl-CoA synthetase (AMP-forming)/AMP-acid ligase II